MPKATPTSGLLISVEGVETQGSLGPVLDSACGPDPLIISGAPWHDTAPPSYDVMAALARWAGTDVFTPGGRLDSAAALQIALQAHRYESVRPDLATGRTVIEHHGVHSLAVRVALSQGSVSTERAIDTARAVVAAVTLWRPLPDLTVWVPGGGRHRGHKVADQVFQQLATDDAERFVVLDGSADSITRLEAALAARTVAPDATPVAQRPRARAKSSARG